ncbi:MAG: hypothetical protein VZR95_01450 [Alphaproteobacteria bacterium]
MRTNVNNNGSNNTVNNNLVCVAGMMVTPDKVQARLEALARGRHIHQEMIDAQAEARAEETRELLEKGYSQVEINNLFRQRHIEDLEARGFGKSKRVVRISVPA